MLLNYLTLLILFICPTLLQAQALAGKVVDQDNQPVPFASVAVPATAQGTTADENGRFELKKP